MKVLKTSKTRQKSYMWVYKNGAEDKTSIVYEYQESRDGKHPTAFLEGFTGYLQGDAYSGYNEIARNPRVTRVGCMAHARRKFMDIVKIAPKKQGYAHQAVEKIKALYDIEAHFREKNYAHLAFVGILFAKNGKGYLIQR